MAKGKKKAAPTAGSAKRRVKKGKLGDIGSVIGSMIPIRGAAQFGRRAGDILGAITGLGAYSVRSNSLLHDMTLGQVPSMHSGNESVVFRHREYLGDVITSSTPGAFNLQQFFINPGLSQTFPWFSAIAANFEEWVPRGIVFEYQTLSADALSSTNTALGTVIAATVYRSSMPTFTSKVQMLNSMWATEIKPSQSMMCPVECESSQLSLGGSGLYIRTGSVPTGEDPKTFDLGVFNIATSGMQAASVRVGDVWISYEIELRKPISTDLVVGTAPTARYAAVNGDGLTKDLPLKGMKLKQIGTENVGVDTIGLTFTNTAINFPQGALGCYLIRWWSHCAGTPSAPINTGALTLANCSIVSAFYNVPGAGFGSEFACASDVTSSQPQTYFECVILIPDSSVVATVTFPTGSTYFGNGAINRAELLVIGGLEPLV